MDELEIAKVLKKIRSVVYHVGTFEGSYPRILKDAPLYTRSHLIVLYEVLPYLKHLLKFASETIPVITRILGLATEGKSDLERASEYLRTINQSSETAVTEIFAALDQVGALLVKAQKAEAADEDLKKNLREANMQLMSIMNALQFQDITSQKIEATNALLAKLGDGLVDLIRELGLGVDRHNIKVREGTYDANAAFDRDSADAKQDEIDALLSSNPQKKKPEKAKQPKPARPSKDRSASKSPSAKADEIDDLVAAVSNGNGSIKKDASPVQAEDAISEADDDKTAGLADQDDIDSLVASTQEENAEEDSEAADQDDIDSLVASTQEENAEEDSEAVGQNDIDSLFASAQGKKGAEGEHSDVSSEVSQDDIDALLGDK